MELQQILQFARDRYIPVMLDDTRILVENTVRQLQPKRILEIGTAVGYSGIIMLQCAPGSTLNTIEYNSKLVRIARDNFAYHNMSDRVNVFYGDARDIVPNLTGQYDLIFMDGPKGQYDVFLPYLVDLLPSGGMLVCDNVLYHGLVDHIPDKHHKHYTIAKKMADFMHHINIDTRLHTTLHKIGDGVTISTKL